MQHELARETDYALWLAFEALAKAYPYDHGVRMTADFAKWIVEERHRQKLPVSAILQKVVSTVTGQPHIATGQDIGR